MTIAATIAFVICSIVAFFCGVRLFIRAYTQMHWLGRGRPGDPILQFIKHIKLRNTAELELIGFLGGFYLAQIAIRFI